MMEWSWILSEVIKALIDLFMGRDLFLLFWFVYAGLLSKELWDSIILGDSDDEWVII